MEFTGRTQLFPSIIDAHFPEVVFWIIPRPHFCGEFASATDGSRSKVVLRDSSR
jgi:hypothetical protein